MPPGLFSAHVDFTRIARAARRHALNVESWWNQAQWLINEGIIQELEAAHHAEKPDYAALSAVQTLLSPAEMGELFKVLVLGLGEADPQASLAIS